MNKIQLKLEDKTKIISIDNIIRIEHDGFWAHIYTEEGIIDVKHSLEYFEACLTLCDFVRIHDMHLVNIKKISAIEKRKTEVIILDDSTEIPLSEEYRIEFGKLIGQKFREI